MNSSILVVATQRELRRELFDALDYADHPQVHSARDLTHAAILLEGAHSPQPLQLLVMVLSGDEQQAKIDCEKIRRLPGCAEAPLIVILTVEASFDPAELPPGVIDWLSAAQIRTELVPRWRRAQASGMDAPPSAAAPGCTEPEDYRYVFEEAAGEWLVLDASGQRVLEVNPSVIRNSHLPATYWAGLALSEGLQIESTVLAQLLEDRDRCWYPAKRKSAQDGDSGQVTARRIRHAGNDAFAVLFRGDRADLRAESALSLLSRIVAPNHGIDAHAAAGRALFDELGLDYLAVWSARRDGADAPAQLLQLWNGEEPVWPSAQMQGSLQQALGGKSMLYRSDAQRLATVYPLLQELDLAGFVALPLLDERRVVLGAMLAGNRRGFGDMSIIEPVLRCAAARFAQLLELAITREQGRAEGLIDALTGLPNRLLFNDRLDTILREATRNGECFALLFVDLDRFKVVNDTYGHATGDQVLRLVTQRLRSSIRASDTVARYAGDEFTVVLRHIVKNDDVLRVAEKIVQMMEAP
ncbi:MAG: GGDEF domain-containing protein, partial [Rhodanobacter sp.]